MPLDKIKDEELPAELKGKTKAGVKVFVAEKAKESETIQKEITALSVKPNNILMHSIRLTPEQMTWEKLLINLYVN